MQVSILSSLKKTSLTKYLVVGLKISLLLGMLYIVSMKLWEHQDSWQGVLMQLQGGWVRPANRWLFAALLLMPLNWWLEAVKWQVLAQRVSKTSLRASLQAVLAGLCLGMISPRSLGDYAGRLLVHGGNHKIRLAGAVFLNRVVQSLSTFLGGLAGILFIVWHLGLWQSDEFLWMLLPGILGTIAVILLMGTFRISLVQWVKEKLGTKWGAWVAVLQDYTTADLGLINAWACLRYAVFCLQFLCVLWWTGLEAPLLLLLAAVSVTFLLKTLMPAFNFLSELGVREFSALLVFSALGLPHAEVIVASLLLWIINICLPALLGTLVVFQLKNTVSFS
jgi:uncharacterized membrane protein YbhN (UPF0104 family)